MQRVADYVINRLVDESINHIFTITGRGILYLTDAVAKNQNIDAVFTYHEQGASYAAMAYAAKKEKMGACLVSTGCASTNAITALLCAWQDNLPIIFISGQNPLNETTYHTKSKKRTFGSQESNIIEIVKSITKYSVMVEDPKDIGCILDEAFNKANSGRKGPVWIDIPLDIQNYRIDENDIKRIIKTNLSIKCVKEDISSVVNDLQQSSRPVILIGGGIRCANAVNIIKKMANDKGIPIVFTTTAADVYGSGNDYSIGAVGSIGGSRAGNFAVQNSDYVLAIGTKLSQQTTGDPNNFARNAKIVSVNVDSSEFENNNVPLVRKIVSDANCFLKELYTHLKPKEEHRQWMQKCIQWKELFSIPNEPFIRELWEKDTIDLYGFSSILSNHLENDVTVITDAGFEELIVPSAIKYHDEQRCIFPSNQGAMGYAIPAIIGAYYAGAEKIVAIVGDGSAMMNIQELQIIASKQIPVVIFVINNNMYAVIRKRQHDLFRNRTIGNDPSDGLPSPDYSRISQGFGIDYCKIDGLNDLNNSLTKVLNSNKPLICEVICTQDQKYLHTSVVINDDKKIIKRSLEDMSPFLDRNIIMKELMIDYLG